MTIAPDFHRMLGGLSFCTILVGFSVPAIAQVIPDDTLGGERSIVTRETIRGVDSDRIDGGSRQGRNLFHSFQQFDVQEGRGAYFSNPADVRNIFSRVTGVDRSEIMGRLGVLGDANLFFMNPNGIVFGPNSSLDVNGSFVGTTANAIQFGEQGFFSATNPEVPSELLTIDPSAFLFNQIGIGSIENSSRAPGRDPSDSFDTFGLQVEDGHSLLLLGGNLTFDQGGLVAFDGRIDLGAVAGTGTVGLNINGDALSLSFPDDLPRSDVTLTNGAGFLVTNTGTGSIVITAQNISVFEGSALGAGILSGQTSNGALPGNIILDAIGTITIADGSYAFNEIYSDAVGSSGDVVIDAAQLTVRDGGQVGILNSGEGTAGNLVVRASGSIELNGGASDSL
ncbi:MAG TPA: filamentous hemagglutinin N-terminal domain-containing protein, partial [Allocoleopsis sp.]